MFRLDFVDWVKRKCNPTKAYGCWVTLRERLRVRTSTQPTKIADRFFNQYLPSIKQVRPLDRCLVQNQQLALSPCLRATNDPPGKRKLE